MSGSKKHSLFSAFGFAIKGLGAASKERNFRLHLISTLLVIILSSLLNITKVEWLIILICIGMVLGMEVINTAIEEIVNFISPEYHLNAGRIKDLAAAAVLIVSIVAFIIALIIFLPYLSIWL